MAAPTSLAETFKTTLANGEPSTHGDGDAMGVAGEIREHLIGTGERGFGVDHPFDPTERLEERTERIGIMKRGILGEELKRAVGVHGGKPLAHQSAEQPREHLDGEKEARLARYPAPPVRREAATRHDAMNVGMMGERRAPAVQHHGDADLGTEMLGIGRDAQERL